jgi:hypothetical protein
MVNSPAVGFRFPSATPIIYEPVRGQCKELELKNPDRPRSTGALGICALFRRLTNPAPTMTSLISKGRLIATCFQRLIRALFPLRLVAYLVKAGALSRCRGRGLTHSSGQRQCGETIAIQFAAQAAVHARRTLLLGLDPQAAR